MVVLEAQQPVQHRPGAEIRRPGRQKRAQRPVREKQVKAVDQDRIAGEEGEIAHQPVLIAHGIAPLRDGEIEVRVDIAPEAQRSGEILVHPADQPCRRRQRHMAGERQQEQQQDPRVCTPCRLRRTAGVLLPGAEVSAPGQTAPKREAEERRAHSRGKQRQRSFVRVLRQTEQKGQRDHAENRPCQALFKSAGRARNGDKVLRQFFPYGNMERLRLRRGRAALPQQEEQRKGEGRNTQRETGPEAGRHIAHFQRVPALCERDAGQRAADLHGLGFFAVHADFPAGVKGYRQQQYPVPLCVDPPAETVSRGSHPC